MNFEFDFSELTQFTNNIANTELVQTALKDSLLEIAKKLLALMKSKTPVEDGTLLAGWDDESALVVTSDNHGFLVKIVNKEEYAVHVNDGHKSFNQFGGPYKVQDEVTPGPFGKPKGRVKVKTPYTKWQQASEDYVYGHFFVERSILEMNESKATEQILMKHLTEWWERL